MCGALGPTQEAAESTMWRPVARHRRAGSSIGCWTLGEESELVHEQATTNLLNDGEDDQGRRRYGPTTQACRTRVDILLVVTSQIVCISAPIRGVAMGGVWREDRENKQWAHGHMGRGDWGWHTIGQTGILTDSAPDRQMDSWYGWEVEVFLQVFPGRRHNKDQTGCLHIIIYTNLIDKTNQQFRFPPFICMHSVSLHCTLQTEKTDLCTLKNVKQVP